MFGCTGPLRLAYLPVYICDRPAWVENLKVLDFNFPKILNKFCMIVIQRFKKLCWNRIIFFIILLYYLILSSLEIFQVHKLSKNHRQFSKSPLFRKFLKYDTARYHFYKRFCHTGWVINLLVHTLKKTNLAQLRNETESKEAVRTSCPSIPSKVSWSSTKYKVNFSHHVCNPTITHAWKLSFMKI